MSEVGILTPVRHHTWALKLHRGETQTLDASMSKDTIMRPPSSYGSMKSDSEGEGDCGAAGGFPEASPAPSSHRDLRSVHRFQMIPCGSEAGTLETRITQRPPGALIIDTRSRESGEEEEEEEEEEEAVTHSPEPEVMEAEASEEPAESSRSDRLHPEQDLAHIFRSLQEVLSDLTTVDLLTFKMYLLKKNKLLQQVMDGDVLDFVDKMLEVFGQGYALLHTINTLLLMEKKPEAERLRQLCQRALIRFHLTQRLIIKHRVIYEGVAQPGKQNNLDTIYVAPQISTQGCGGVDPSHELRDHPPSPVQFPSADTLVDLKDLFRLKNKDGRPVRTVVSTGLPGIGLTVCVRKFCLDWAGLCSNKDLQFIIKLSFHNLWCLRSKVSRNLSMMEVIQYYHPEFNGSSYMEEEGCRFLLVMDSFDCYLAPLDWENSPVVEDASTPAHLDVLLVNLLRGSLLRRGCVWILGRSAAVSQIPPGLVDAVTEVQGFSDQKKDQFFTRRYPDAQLASQIVAWYKRLPSLHVLARQPVVCWMVATVFEFCFQSDSFGGQPPRLTPFYINLLILRTNRCLELYKQPEKVWSSETRRTLTRMGELALRLLQSDSSVFSEDQLTASRLNLMEVVVFSGLCTELPPTSSGAPRKFCFLHLTVQEFMAALYVFTVFRSESRNVLESERLGRRVPASAASLVQRALELTLVAPLGRYDMLLRFLCGLLAPDCHHRLLSGLLFPHNAAAVAGLQEVQRLLEESISRAAEQHAGARLHNLRECLREMTQEEE